MTTISELPLTVGGEASFSCVRVERQQPSTTPGGRSRSRACGRARPGSSRTRSVASRIGGRRRGRDLRGPLVRADVAGSVFPQLRRPVRASSRERATVRRGHDQHVARAAADLDVVPKAIAEESTVPSTCTSRSAQPPEIAGVDPGVGRADPGALRVEVELRPVAVRHRARGPRRRRGRGIRGSGRGAGRGRCSTPRPRGRRTRPARPRRRAAIRARALRSRKPKGRHEPLDRSDGGRRGRRAGALGQNPVDRLTERLQQLGRESRRPDRAPAS